MYTSKRIVKSPAVKSRLCIFIRRAIKELFEMKITWYIYKDKSGKWRWRAVSGGNNKIIGSSSQGYVEKYDCLDNGHLFKKNKTPWHTIKI